VHDQNPLARENHSKVEVMSVSFALLNLDARTEISLLTLGNLLFFLSFIVIYAKKTYTTGKSISSVRV
jgi:hypothetical protein